MSITRRISRARPSGSRSGPRCSGTSATGWRSSSGPAERAVREEAEPWLPRLNAIAAVPVVMFFGFIAFLVALYLLIKFIETFAVQLLIAAPAVAAGAQLYRLRPRG